MLDSDSPVNSSGDQCCCIGISSQSRSLSSYIACQHPKEEDCGISNFITFESEMQEPEVHRPAGSSVCAAGCPLPTSSTLNRSFNLGMTGAIWTANPAPQRPRPRVPQERRPAPSPPMPGPRPRVLQERRRPNSRPTQRRQRGRTSAKSPPYASPRQRESHQGQEPTVIPSEESAFGSHNFLRADGRGRNLFQEFMASLPRPISATAVRSPPRTRTPSPDIFLELYSHTRHPFDYRTHLTILPSWARKVEKKSQGECVICYGEDRHLQIKYKSFGTIKVCCHCVVGVYQSINSCPVCRFRGEF